MDDKEKRLKEALRTVFQGYEESGFDKELTITALMETGQCTIEKAALILENAIQ